MEPMNTELGYPSMLPVSSEGRKGGLALIWATEVVADTQTYSLNHIDANICTQNSPSWRLTGVCGRPEEERKVETWRLIRHLNARGTLPWLCLGNFNEILSSDEKKGGNPKQVTAMLAFQHTLLQCGLVDLGFRGYRFTWRNGQHRATFVEERLDRFVATLEWKNMFPKAIAPPCRVLFRS
ncbi:uncharacterized protein LOC142632701 [Castanea sativa]|uniref:uncharacterized protein LOC142632701 n=1 Tax=Castanea sativa TaxID=21020 RepID=UPI003F64BAA0